MTSGEIIAIVCSLTGAITSVLVVVFMNRKQRVGVSFDFVPANKLEFDKHVERNRIEHELIAEKMLSTRREIDIHLSARAKTIFDKIDSVVGTLRTEMQQQTDRRDETIQTLRSDLETKMDDNRKELAEQIGTMQTNMPGQIVGLLKNTGAI